MVPAQCNRSILEIFRPLFVSSKDKTQLNATGEGGGKSAEINISAYKNYLLCNPNLLNVIVCSCAFVCLNTATELYSCKITARYTSRAEECCLNGAQRVDNRTLLFIVSAGFYLITGNCVYDKYTVY